MMLPPSIPTVPSDQTARLAMMEDESLVEGYGESSGGARNLTGGVDFFSDMGTEYKNLKGDPKRNKPNPDHVCHT